MENEVRKQGECGKIRDKLESGDELGKFDRAGSGRGGNPVFQFESEPFPCHYINLSGWPIY